MANTDFNTSAILVNGTETPLGGTATTVTGSFSGFTVLSGSVNFTSLVDYFGNELSPLDSTTWASVPDGTTVSLFISSSTVASGSVLFYAISTETPTETPNAPAPYNYATWVTKSLP